MKNLLILSLFISAIVLVMTLSIYFYYLTPLDKFSYPTTAFVTQDTLGFDVNSTAITFGNVIVGGSSSRSILVNNSYPFAVKVKPNFSGNIASLISYEPLIVGPYSVSKLYLTISPTNISMIGNYTGMIDIELLRAGQ
jgi:hypothetical protein